MTLDRFNVSKGYGPLVYNFGQVFKSSLLSFTAIATRSRRCGAISEAQIAGHHMHRHANLIRDGSVLRTGRAPVEDRRSAQAVNAHLEVADRRRIAPFAPELIQIVCGKSSADFRSRDNEFQIADPPRSNSLPSAIWSKERDAACPLVCRCGGQHRHRRGVPVSS